MRKLIIAAVLALALAACGGSGSDRTSPTTAPVTTTTQPDPAATACRQLNSNVEERPKDNPALDQLTLSRDTRIVAAAQKVEQILLDRSLDDTVPPDLDLEYTQSVLELVRACKVAGYLP
jgi:hypothetical protein